MVVSKASERGATLLLVTFVATFLLIPIIGLCIDAAELYWFKARLSAAIDATALATARSLNVGQTAATQIGNATLTGQAYFKANFPPGLMRSTVVGGAPTITIDETSLHKRIVTVTVSVTVPLFGSSPVTASGQATRRDANVMLVLDRSNSMNLHGSCAALVASAQNFVSQFVDGRDQLGLVTYQTGAKVDYAPTLYFKSSNPSLNSVLGTLVCGGDTNTEQGLYMAYDQIQNVINQPGALNVILLFTDGQPNTLVAKFPIKTLVDNRYSATNTSQIMPTGASTCFGTGTLLGAIADGSAETATDIYGLNQTGDTYAVFSAPSVPISTASGINPISASGCSFTSNVRYGRRDIAAIPTQDADGNSTVDGGYIALDYFPLGYQYALQIRPDMPRTVRWAAFNIVDSLAQKIRSDTVYTPITFTIGLQGNETMAMNQDFMERVANDARASNYDSTKPQGQFILATNTLELSQAFQQIASQILRLSR
jgi:Flp pilus assembly protein TadG/uncharacterized membrane protein